MADGKAILDVAQLDAATAFTSYAFDGSFSFDPNTTAEIYLGTSQSGAVPFKGVIDDVRIYNYAIPDGLNPTEAPDEPDMVEVYYEMSEIPLCRYIYAGDVNGDCQVNLADFALLAENWLECSLSPAESCP